VIVRTKSPAETWQAGYDLGRTLQPGQVVALYGELGAGKTVFVKGIAAAFGIPSEDVTSASFTIIAEYDSTPPLYHIDLYRIASPEDLESTGVHEYLGGRGVAVIEWAERIELQHAISVRIEHQSENERIISILRSNT
jgi:tRNA threonylcarbamoyladenosine biosynthesis protein TsaE